MITAATCLAMAVYFEARGEPLDGQLAVGEVIMNRVVDPRFAGDVCSVVKEDWGPAAYDCQFSFWCDGLPEEPRDAVAWATSRDIAQQVLDGDVLGHGATHYHSVSVHPWWADADEIKPVGMIGNHLFYVWEK